MHKTKTEAVYIALYASNANVFIMSNKTSKNYFAVKLFQSVFSSCTAI